MTPGGRKRIRTKHNKNKMCSNILFAMVMNVCIASLFIIGSLLKTKVLVMRYVFACLDVVYMRDQSELLKHWSSFIVDHVPADHLHDTFAGFE